MYLHPEVSDAEVPRLVEEFIGITGLPVWIRRRAWLNQQVKQNEFLAPYHAQIYALELEFFRALTEREKGGHLDLRAATAERYRVFAFIAAVASAYKQLSPLGQKRLKGMIVGGLKDSGLTPLQQEMSVAAHLFSRGFDVSFSDMETGGGFDYLAAKEGIELEVECKRVGLDLGRKVPRLETHHLQKRIYGQVKTVFPKLNCGLLLRVILPGRLTTNEPLQQAIASAVGKVCLTGVPLVTDNFEVKLHEFQIQGTLFEPTSGQPDMRSIRAFMAERFDIHNREVFVMGQQGKRVLAVSIESKLPDTLVDNLFAELSNSAANQLSKKRPGVLCVQFIDLTDEQIRRMGSASDDETSRRPSYIWQRTSEFLQSTRRSHVHSVVFRGVGNVGQEAAIRGEYLTREVQEAGSAFFVMNQSHPLTADRRYAIFGEPVAPSRIAVA